MPSLYLESTIPSYLTAWPTNDLIAAAHQAMTREWWQLRRDDFELYTSQLVIEEISAGDPTASALRLATLDQIPILPLTDEVEFIASELNRKLLIPTHAEADAFHIAFASSHKLDYLLTWNCKHIANAERLPAIEKFLSDSSFHTPIVCTPEELMGD